MNCNYWSQTKYWKHQKVPTDVFQKFQQKPVWVRTITNISEAAYTTAEIPMFGMKAKLHWGQSQACSLERRKLHAVLAGEPVGTTPEGSVLAGPTWLLGPQGTGTHLLRPDGQWLSHVRPRAPFSGPRQPLQAFLATPPFSDGAEISIPNGKWHLPGSPPS